MGLVNRGRGCARRDNLGIFARVKVINWKKKISNFIIKNLIFKAHLKWIKANVKYGRC